MSFLNNSGDIILDVVLTDEGRRRLAKADGTFEISKFALSDDEINYALFETGSTTALQDLSILQTPILEAFTNNSSAMKSKLLSLPDQTDLLYLPILKLNEQLVGSAMHDTTNVFVICVDSRTWEDSVAGQHVAIGYGLNQAPRQGMIYGLDTTGLGSFIAIDSGIDSTDYSRQTDLIETQFMIEMDNRLGTLVTIDGGVPETPQSIDDDHIATYVISKRRFLGGTSVSSPFITEVENANGNQTSDSPLNGPIGARLKFKIRSSEELRSSNFLFDRIGSTDATSYTDRNGAAQSVRIIDSMIKVTGMTRGYTIDIPVRFAKSI